MFCMTRGVLRLTVYRCRLVWSGVWRSWRERCAQSPGAWGEKEGPISGRLCLTSCRRWHFPSLTGCDPSIPHLPVDTFMFSHIQRECQKKKNLEMTWRHLDTMEGCGQDKKEHNTFTWFTYQRQHIDPHQYDVNVVKFHLQSLSRLKLYFTNEHDIQKQTKRHQSS